MYDFGYGSESAHKHINGGGWVADTATVSDSTYIGPNAKVHGDAEEDGTMWLVEGLSEDGRFWGWEYVAPGGRQDALCETEEEAARLALSACQSLPGCLVRVVEVQS